MKMVGNDWENSLNCPNSSKSLRNCPKMSQNGPSCPKMSQDVHFRRIVVRMDLFFIETIGTVEVPVKTIVTAAPTRSLVQSACLDPVGVFFPFVSGAKE